MGEDVASDLRQGSTVEILDESAQLEESSGLRVNAVEISAAESSGDDLGRWAPQAVGFTSGRGKALPAPSKKSLARARKLIDEEEGDDYACQETKLGVSQHLVKRARLDVGTKPLGDVDPRTATDGLHTAKRSAVPESRVLVEEEAVDLINGGDSQDFTMAASSPSSLQQAVPTPASQFGFHTGRGAPVPLPSSAARKRALKLFEDPDDSLSQSGTARPMESGSIPLPALPSRFRTPMRPISSGVESGFRAGSVALVPSPTTTYSRKKVLDLPMEAKSPTIVDFDSRQSFKVSTGSLSDAMPSSSNCALTKVIDEDSIHVFSQPSPTPAHKSHLDKSSTPVRASIRTPLSTKTNIHASMKKPIQIKTPSGPLRRIGLGSTPSNSSSRRRFVTPFRNTQSQPTELAIVSRAPVKLWEPVFDLVVPSNRLSLKKMHLHPQYYTPEDLAELEIPKNLRFLTLQNAVCYQFLSSDPSNKSVLGSKEALSELRAKRCLLATAKWVDNHWAQILWKLGGEIQAKPDLFEQKWTWNEVILQLLYRYEREYGAAQRPLVRRIQEHDSSASLPMVLVVSDIHYGQDKNGNDQQEPDIHLELTDGWYPIKARIDQCLRRAVTRGRITVGRKIAITGAKLDAGNEGAEVLDAVNSSHLVLSGNSTSLAKWHCRLGMQPRPFTASLSSLSVDGGVITLMDIVVDKLYPMAFTNGDKEAREPPWGIDEERSRHDIWKERYTAEQTRLHDKMKKDMNRLRDLAGLLAQYAEESGGTYKEAPEDIEDDLEDILNTKDFLSCLGGVSSDRIIHLAHCARARLEREMGEGQSEIETELQTLCPPRNVRDFRMIRFKDAQEGFRDAFRMGMLSVWDAKSFDMEALREGRRYLVSNLVPGKSGDWRVDRTRTEKREVYLHTRRDTRWQPIE